MKLDKIFKDGDMEKIRAAVEKVEMTTSGEVVPAIVGKSDHYHSAQWRIALLFVFLTTLATYYFVPYYPLEYYLVFEVLLLVPGFLIARIPCLLRAFIHKSDLTEEVHQRAFQMFYEQGLHNTRDKTGVLIFASLFERRVEIIADAGINTKVYQGQWEEIVSRMISDLKQGDITSTFIKAIEKCGSLLKEHYPKKSDDKDELKNDLVVE